MENLQRVAWVDIFKGLLIVSMVLGHATGAYNMYIYQFHMGAFFLISGYTTYLSKRNILETIAYKFYSFYFPFIGMFFIVLLALYAFKWWMPDLNFNAPFPPEVLNHSADWFWDEFLEGRIWVAPLGAAWFLPTLFFAVVGAKLLQLAAGEKSCLPVLFAMAFAYNMYAMRPYHSAFIWDLSLIALCYFYIGIALRNYGVFSWIANSSKWSKAGVLFVTILGFQVFAYIFHINMNWPDHAFGQLGWDCAAVLNDSIFMAAAAMVVEKVKFLREGLIYIGKNTLAILMLHFIGFKIAFAVLGIPVSEFLPPQYLSMDLILICVFIAIGSSILLWNVLLKIPGADILLGQNKDFFKWIVGIFKRKCHCSAVTPLERDASHR